MENYNKYTMHNDNNYPTMQPPNQTVNNDWIGDVTVLQTVDVAAIIKQPQNDSETQKNITSGRGDSESGNSETTKTWADMVKKSGNCSSGETRFCVGPTVGHHDRNGVKTIGGEKRRSAANGRYSTDKPPRGGLKNNYGSSFSANNYQDNNNGPRMNNNNNKNFYDRGYHRRGPNFKHALVGGNGSGSGQIDIIDQTNNNVGNNGSEQRSVNTSIVPMVSLQQQFYGMNLGTSVTMPPPGIFQDTTFNAAGGRPRMIATGGGAGSAYIPVEGGEFQTSYMTFAAHTTSSALFVPSLPYGGGQSSSSLHAPISMEVQHHSPQSLPQHQMTTTQQLHLWQQQQQAALFQQQKQAARSHAPVPQPQPSPQQPKQPQLQHGLPPHGQQLQQQAVHIQQQHPQQQSVASQPPLQSQQMQPMQVPQQHLQGQASAAGPPQGGPQPPPAIPQFFIPAAFSANSPNGAALVFSQPIVPIPTLGHHMGQPSPMICTPPGASANNVSGLPPGVDAVAAATGGPIFVHPGFQDERFRNTWLQQDCLPSVQWFNERCLQNYLLTHNNNIMTAKERSAANADNGNKESVILPNLLLASSIQFNGGGGATSAKPFHLKA